MPHPLNVPLEVVIAKSGTLCARVYMRTVGMDCSADNCNILMSTGRATWALQTISPEVYLVHVYLLGVVYLSNVYNLQITLVSINSLAEQLPTNMRTHTYIHCT